MISLNSRAPLEEYQAAQLALLPEGEQKQFQRFAKRFGTAAVASITLDTTMAKAINDGDDDLTEMLRRFEARIMRRIGKVRRKAESLPLPAQMILGIEYGFHSGLLPAILPHVPKQVLLNWAKPAFFIHHNDRTLCSLLIHNPEVDFEVMSFYWHQMYETHEAPYTLMERFLLAEKPIEDRYNLASMVLAEISTWDDDLSVFWTEAFTDYKETYKTLLMAELGVDWLPEGWVDKAFEPSENS